MKKYFYIKDTKTKTAQKLIFGRFLNYTVRL